MHDFILPCNDDQKHLNLPPIDYPEISKSHWEIFGKKSIVFGIWGVFYIVSYYNSVHLWLIYYNNFSWIPYILEGKKCKDVKKKWAMPKIQPPFGQNKL